MARSVSRLSEESRASTSSLAVTSSLVAYCIFFLEGIGYLFPWNACITAAAYYKSRFCGTTFESSFENYYGVAYNFTLILTLPFVLKYGDKYSWTSKIVGPLLGFFMVVASILLLVFFDVDPVVLFYITIMQIATLGVCASILSDGLFGFAALFPSQYIGSAVSGIAAAGFAAAISNILTSVGTAGTSVCEASETGYVYAGNSGTDLGIDDDTEQCEGFSIHSDAVAYFTLTVVLIVACVGGYVWLEALPITRSINDHYERQFVRSLNISKARGSQDQRDKDLHEWLLAEASRSILDDSDNSSDIAQLMTGKFPEPANAVKKDDTRETSGEGSYIYNKINSDAAAQAQHNLDNRLQHGGHVEDIMQQMEAVAKKDERESSVEVAQVYCPPNVVNTENVSIDNLHADAFSPSRPPNPPNTPHSSTFKGSKESVDRSPTDACTESPDTPMLPPQSDIEKGCNGTGGKDKTPKRTVSVSFRHSMRIDSGGPVHGEIPFSVILKIAWRIRQPILCIFFVFFGTLCVFPSLVVLYKSQYACEAPGDDGEVVFTTMYGDLFVPILFLIYNFCDLVGRLIAGNFKLVYTPKTILPGALVRLLVIPLILFSDLKNSRLPVIVSSDVWAIFLMVIFGLSNGHLTGSSMILGPMMVDEVDAPLAGTLMVFGLNAGCLTGAFASFVLLYMSQGSFTPRA